MKNVYLVAAILGAVIPYFFFVQHFDAQGCARTAFLAQIFANPAASGFSADLVISSFVFWLFMFRAGEGAPKPWPFVVINLLIGLSCALPAYLYWQMRDDQT